MPFRLAAILGLGLFGWPLWEAATYTAPALLTDWQIQGSARGQPGLRAEQVKCTNWNLMLNICSMTLVAGPAGEIRRAVVYAFVGPSLGRFRVEALADPARPDWVTTDLGLSHLVNRSICLGVFLIATIPLFVAALFGALGILRPAQRF